MADQVSALAAYLPDLAPDDRERVDGYVARASAEATLRAYQSDWRLFCAWCEESGYRYAARDADDRRGLPDPTGGARLRPTDAASGAGRREALAKPLGRSTIGRRLSAIVFAHCAAGFDPPTQQSDGARLEKAMRAIRRDKRDDPSGKKRPADGDVMRDMLRTIDGEDLRSYRDRALLAIGMAGAFRRSELVAITVGRVSDDTRGLLVRVPTSKTDQEGRGHRAAIPDGRRLGAVRHYRAWLEKAAIETGPVFRKLTPQGRLTAQPISAQGVALVVKAAARSAGYPEALFSRHSLRAGFLTKAGRQNANLFKMREHIRINVLPPRTNAHRAGGRGCRSRCYDRDGIYHADWACRRPVRSRGSRGISRIVE